MSSSAPILIVMATALAGAAVAAERASAPGAAASTAEAQIAAGSERLKASAARLKSAARAAEAQPGSSLKLAELKMAVAEMEASCEYVIGMFSALNAKDRAQQLELMRSTLAALKKQKKALMDELQKKTGEAASRGVRQAAPGFVALADQALASAAVQPPPGSARTPPR